MQKKGERKPSPSQRFPTQVLTYRFKGLEKSSQPMAPLAIVFCFQWKYTIVWAKRKHC